MTFERSIDYLNSLFAELIKLPGETEWVEFKYNRADHEEIGQYISALSNSAALYEKASAYLIWGIKDSTHEVVGTTFKPNSTKIGNEELESWLLRMLAPKIHFRFFEFEFTCKNVVILEIACAFKQPVQFQHNEYIRVKTNKKKLKDFPEKERELWRIFEKTPFELQLAKEEVSDDEVIKLLDYPSYFDLLDLPLPSSKNGILKVFESEEMIVKTDTAKWNITNLGAILFAKKLSDFSLLKRKAIRVILYRNNSRIETVKEQIGGKGYAVCF
jgi:predicted HTH transcriptional regulator